MINLYDSAFSPFARKVRMVLDHKGLAYKTIDGLLKSNHAALSAVNGRIEVPALVDGDIVVVNSPDIVAYLDHRYPQMPVYPEEPAARVHARAWERLSDTFVDPIFVDISYWKWAERPDQMPQGLLEAARADLRNVYDALDKDLADRDTPPLKTRPPSHLARWFQRIRALPICAADLPEAMEGRSLYFRRTRDYVVNLKDRDFERRRIFWRGDRIEWLLARGFHAWFFDEIRQDRVVWPGPPLPVPGAADDARSAFA
jgi:glutathione S-transferase